MTEQRQRAPPPAISEAQKKMLRFQMIYLMISFGMLVIISDRPLATALGDAANVVFAPAIGFNYRYPLWTLLLSGILIGLITSIPRYLFTDWIKYGRTQLRSRAYSKAIRDAYRNNQRDKIQKLNKMRTEHMMEMQSMQMQTMKPLMVLTIFTIFIFIWLDFSFITPMGTLLGIGNAVPYALIAFPWGNVLITTSKVWLMPTWIAVYFLASLVIGYFAFSIAKYIDFSYRIRKLREKESAAVQWN